MPVELLGAFGAHALGIGVMSAHAKPLEHFVRTTRGSFVGDFSIISTMITVIGRNGLESIRRHPAGS